MSLWLVAVAEVICNSIIFKEEYFCNKSSVIRVVVFKIVCFSAVLSERNSCELEIDQLKFCLISNNFRGSLVTDFVIPLNLSRCFKTVSVRTSIVKGWRMAEKKIPYNAKWPLFPFVVIFQPWGQQGPKRYDIVGQCQVPWAGLCQEARVVEWPEERSSQAQLPGDCQALPVVCRQLCQRDGDGQSPRTGDYRQAKRVE